MRETLDYYAALEVPFDALPEEIKRSYRRLVRENHPDIAPDPDAAHAKMQLILTAYGVLSNPESRDRYDREIARIERGNRSTPGKPPSYPPQGDTYGSVAHDRARKSRGMGTRPSGVAAPEVVRRARAAQNMRQAREGSAENFNPRTRSLTMVFEAAQMFFLEERAAEAITMCNRVLQDDPRNPEAAALLGDIYLAQDRKDMALPMFERAMLAQPSNLLYKQKWNALRRGDPVPASTFRPPTPPGADEKDVPTVSTSAANGSPEEAAPPIVATEETSGQELRTRLGLNSQSAASSSTVSPSGKPKGKPILGRLFGRGK